MAARVDVRPTKSGDHWSAIFRDTDKPGDYRIKVTANDGAQELGTAEARFLVPNQDIELDRPAAEPSLMAQLAEMTAAAGGKALAPEELPTLLADARRRTAQAPRRSRRQNHLLGHLAVLPGVRRAVGQRVVSAEAVGIGVMLT